MSTTLTYFDFDGSRGLECRLALTVAGVDFHDERITREQWLALKPTLPFGALPVLDDEHGRLAQSSAILRYVGAVHGLHPSDPAAAAKHDALMQSVEDLRHKVPSVRGLSEEDAKAKRGEFASGWLSRWAATVHEQIEGPFVSGDELSVVDLKLYVILRGCLGGIYDHVPASTFDGLEKLAGLVAAVDAHPAVAAYWASRG